MRWLHRRTDTRGDLDREIQFHLAEEERLRTERRASPERARLEARGAFGNLMRVHAQVDRLNAIGRLASCGVT
jgi:hypothetical protein